MKLKWRTTKAQSKKVATRNSCLENCNRNRNGEQHHRRSTNKKKNAIHTHTHTQESERYFFYSKIKTHKNKILPLSCAILIAQGRIKKKTYDFQVDMCITLFGYNKKLNFDATTKKVVFQKVYSILSLDTWFIRCLHACCVCVHFGCAATSCNQMNWSQLLSAHVFNQISESIHISDECIHFIINAHSHTHNWTIYWTVNFLFHDT